MSETLQSIPMEKIVPSKTNPRKHFKHNDFAELVASVKAKGVLVPILVRPVNGSLEIVYGEQRFRAATVAKLDSIPAVVQEYTDEEALEISIIENLQRKDVHRLDEAEGFVALSKIKTPEQIAAVVGKPVSYVLQAMRLTKLIEPAKREFYEDRFTVSHAILIARLQPKEQERALTFAIKTWQRFGGEFEYHNSLNPDVKSEDMPRGYDTDNARTVCSVKDLERFIDQRILLDLRSAAFDKKATYEKLLKAGACITCPKRTGHSKELFNDITQGDTCTDPACFASKQQAHFEQLKASLKKEKKRFIEITEDQRKPEGHKGAITERSFKLVKGKPCKHVRVGIYIDGSNMGKTVTICNAKKECKQHWAEYQKERSSQNAGHSGGERIDYAEQQRRDKENRRRGWQRFRPIAEEIWRRSAKTLPAKFDFIGILSELIVGQIAYDLKDCKPRGFKPTPIQIINLGMLCQQYDFDIKFNGSIHPDLYKAAKKLGIKYEAHPAENSR